MQLTNRSFGTGSEHSSTNLAFLRFPRVVRIAQNGHDIVLLDFRRSQNMRVFVIQLSDAHNDSTSYFGEADRVLLFADQQRRSSKVTSLFLGEDRTM